MASRKRNLNRSFSVFTRRNPMVWAWAFRLAVRLSRSTEASSSRSPTMGQGSRFGSRSIKENRTQRRTANGHEDTKGNSREGAQRSQKKGEQPICVNLQLALHSPAS